MTKEKLHKAKFYCENCGYEVPQNAKFCSKCGKFFTFVRCPSCQYTSESRKFTNGCPKCGYAVKPYGGIFDAGHNHSKKSAISHVSTRASFSPFSSSKSKSDSNVPFWFLIVAVVVLIAVILLFYSCI
ncbi:MAG: zinc ribbon domain-containing protein [Treponema sp.]|nr:zinc ribbon domain-containing protein [Treponema sp.]